MNNKFDSILHENEQTLFVVKKGTTEPISMDYSRVFYNCLFEIHKKSVDNRSIVKIDSDEFDVITSEGKTPVTFNVVKDYEKAKLSKEQYERILIDSSCNIYKLDQSTNRAVPADPRAGFSISVVS